MSAAGDKAQEEEALGATYDVRTLRRLAAYLAPERGLVMLSGVMLLALSAAALVRPLIMGRIVSSAQSGGADAIVRWGLGLAGVVVATQLAQFAQGLAMQIAGARAMTTLRAEVFAFLQRLELRYLDRTPVGRLVTRATNDIDAIAEAFVFGVVNSLGDIIALAGMVAMMVALHAKLSVVSFLALPVVGILVNVVRVRARTAYRDIRVRTARLNAFLNEQVAGMSVVQAYAREDAMRAEFAEINGAYRDANKVAVINEAILDAAIELVSTVCVASVLWWVGLRRFEDAALTFPLVVTFTQYIRQFFEPVSMLAQRYTVLQSALSGAERVFQLLDEPCVEDDSGTATEGSDRASVEALAFEAVGFEYKAGVPVLDAVSFTVRPGERIALVGATGAGKSTVTSLLLRLYDATTGAVRVMGRDVREWRRGALRARFAVVPQEVFLFSGTVLSNIAVGDATPDIERVRDVLERLGALPMVAARPGALDAIVDPRGANFSAGERQLLAFARALYRDAPIVLLDEATASIDSATETQVQAALDVLCKGRTALIVAHRLATIRLVDRILCFHKGRIVEQGSHDELVARGGVYARLHRMQFAREARERMEAAAPLSAE